MNVASPVCCSCGGPRSYGSASLCRACYRAGNVAPAIIGRGEDGVEIQIVLTLRGPLADSLTGAANDRERDPAELLADIIETVLGEKLIDAVLDDAA